MRETPPFDAKDRLLKVEQQESLHLEDRNIDPGNSKAKLRNTDVAFVLTGIVTTVAGGPVITAWSVLFFFLGRENDVPNWLRCLAVLFCSALTDAFISNFSSLGINTGLLPYILFGFGTTISAVLDYDEFFRLDALPGSGSKNIENNVDPKRHIDSVTTGFQVGVEAEIQDWDKAFEEKRGVQDR